MVPSRFWAAPCRLLLLLPLVLPLPPPLCRGVPGCTFPLGHPSSVLPARPAGARVGPVRVPCLGFSPASPGWSPLVSGRPPLVVLAGMLVVLACRCCSASYSGGSPVCYIPRPSRCTPWFSVIVPRHALFPAPLRCRCPACGGRPRSRSRCQCCTLTLDISSSALTSWVLQVVVLGPPGSRPGSSRFSSHVCHPGPCHHPSRVCKVLWSNKPAISATAEIRCHCSRDIRSVLCLAV